MAFAALVSIGVLSLAEGVARLSEPMLPGWRADDPGDVVMVGHSTRLWGMGAGERRNGPETATIHSSGLREPIPEGPRAAGEERILVLGDSTYFGHSVADEETFAFRLQAGLFWAGGAGHQWCGARLFHRADFASVGGGRVGL